MKINNPSVEETIEVVEEDNAKTLEEKLQLLKYGQEAWRQTPLSQRMACIKKYSELLESNIEELAKTLTRETGKPLQESKNEINGARGRIEFFIQESEKWLKPNRMGMVGNTEEVLEFEPLGVICNISAWNYPYLVGVNVQIPALIGGNAVLYKPSEFATLTGKHMQELYYQAGVPENVFQVAIGAREVGEKLLDMPLQGYFFTGSYKTGLAIQQKVAPKLVPVGLELGGKDPLYVTDEIQSVEAAAASAVEGAFYNNGQSCCAVERIYVHQKVYDQFVTDFVNEVNKLTVGDPFDPKNTQGALTRPSHIEFLDEQVADAKQKGAKLHTGGGRAMETGAFYSPTVFSETNHSMRIMKEESFGPIIGIQKVSGDEEAFEMMNDTEYGLTASVFCTNQERAKKILQKLEVGNAYVNCSDRVSPQLPWAGQRGSGLGSTLGYLGILAFVRPKGYHLRG